MYKACSEQSPPSLSWSSDVAPPIRCARTFGRQWPRTTEPLTVSDKSNRLVHMANVEKALAAAVAAIRFDDASDYRSALWIVVEALGGSECSELLADSPTEAWVKYCEKRPRMARLRWKAGAEPGELLLHRGDGTPLATVINARGEQGCRYWVGDVHGLESTIEDAKAAAMMHVRKADR